VDPKDKLKGETKMKTSAKERRKKLDRAFDKNMYRKSGKKRWKFYQSGVGERKPLICEGCKERIYKARVIDSKDWCDKCLAEGKHENPQEHNQESVQ